MAAGSDGLVVVRDITFAALSEHSLLPFHGRAHIAYVPADGVVLGLSKLARVTKCLAARLQTQAQFTQRLVGEVQAAVGARGVAAVVQALHLGGGPAPAAQLSSAATGCFTQPGSGHLAEFLALLRLSGRSTPPASGFCDGAAAAAALERQQSGDLGTDMAGDAEVAPLASSSMVAATQQLLQSVGEDPARKVGAWAWPDGHSAATNLLHDLCSRWPFGSAHSRLLGHAPQLAAAAMQLAAVLRRPGCSLPPAHPASTPCPPPFAATAGPQGRRGALRQLAAQRHGRVPHAATRLLPRRRLRRRLQRRQLAGSGL